jgi:hypothetical protein
MNLCVSYNSITGTLVQSVHCVLQEQEDREKLRP